jgi:hypothetical protein
MQRVHSFPTVTIIFVRRRDTQLDKNTLRSDELLFPSAIYVGKTMQMLFQAVGVSQCQANIGNEYNASAAGG